MEGTRTKPTRTIVGGASLDTPERSRAYHAAAQRDLNVYLQRLGSPSVLAVDGEWDSDSQLAFERVCRILGVDAVRDVRTFRLIGASVADRTEAEKQRALTDGAAFARQLEAQFAAAASTNGDGQPHVRKRTVVGGRSLPKDDRARAYVAALQRDLNRHLIALGSPAVLAVDGTWDRDTDVAFRRVCRVLGLEAHRNVRTFRAIAGAAAPLTEAERKQAAADGTAYEKDLRHHFAHAPVPKPPEPHKPEPEEKPDGTDELCAALRKAGARYEDAIVREARRHGVPVSLVCAVLEVETGFQNVYGHDAVRNPIKSPPRGLKVVTEESYKQYLHFRRQGLGNQGVGPMQLTSPGLQDRADTLGGCWRVDPNLRVGVEYLAGNIQRLGLYRGVAAYNGSTAYADKVLPLEKKWRAKLGSATDAGHGGGGAGPRTLKVRNPRMRGSDVEALQKLINKRFDEWKVGVRIDVDGEYGPETRKAARRVAYALGVPASDYDRGITPALRSKLRRPSRRSAAELERAKGRRPWLRKLRRAHASAGVSSNGNYPLGVHGPIIGTPFHGTHTRGNWQSDNALDIRIPNGTPVFALDDGVIVKTFKSPSGVTAGWQVTLRSSDNAWFYGHLTTVTVRAGERVRKGQTIGTSGSANGVPHLHIGQQVGRPRFQ
jgi:murein DD-endopeptidase MepM/ murein hydrolase activator NlpD